MEDRYYVVSKIDGDYALLTLKDTQDTILVARALLPEEIDEGTNLKFTFESFSYTII